MWEIFVHPSNIFFSVSLCLMLLLGLVSEAAFAAQPYQVGQGVQLHWTPEQAHPLSAPAMAVDA